jgi:ABC-type polysaccharide/polyol phosphate export permease
MELRQSLVELYHYRELLRNLVARDLKVRYKNSVLGFLWSLINPLLMMLVFTVVFTIMMPSSALEHFSAFVLIGLLPWNWFSSSITGGLDSVVGHADLVRKVYFPHEVLPISVVLSNLVNFVLALLVLFPLLLFSHIPITPWVLFLPLIILAQLFFTVGLTFLLATANVFYRDMRVIMEVVLLAWFFLTPVFYPIEILPRQYTAFGVTINVWRWTFYLNPMASLVASYREVLYRGIPPAADFFARTFFTAVAFLVVGYFVFHRFSPVFSEEV